MGLPELLFLAGLVLVFAGILVLVLASSYALLRQPGRGEGMGLVLIGPIPVLVAGRTTRLLLALAILMALAIIATSLLVVLMGVV